MPAILEHLERHFAKWRLTLDGEPFETISSWLAYVTRDGQRAVLKVFKPGSNEAPGARYLTLHKGLGAVRVLESDDDAVLIERIAPGTLLATLPTHDRDDEACHIVCDTIEKLQQSRVSPTGWPGHAEHLEQFDLLPAAQPLTAQIAARARAMFVELDASERQRVLLHGDLHHGNILLDGARGWLVIDPKGNVGELEFECASFLHNPTREFCEAGHIARRVHIVATRLGLDAERLVRWCFAHGVLSALWAVEDDVFDANGGVQAAHAALDVLGQNFGI